MNGGSSPDRGWEFFSSPPRPDRIWISPNLLSSGYQSSSLGLKRPVCEADHSPPSSAEVKNAWSYTSTPQHAFCCYKVKSLPPAWGFGVGLTTPHREKRLIAKCYTDSRNWQALVNTVMIFGFHKRRGISWLAEWVTVSFWSRTLLHGASS
jgi:hypothetical protein